MSLDLTSPLTGGAQTGFTTPTYTHVADTPPDINAKQRVVTALGGTQAGVTAHSVSSPFVISVWRPKQMAVLGRPNPTTGLISSVPRNVYKVITLKGVTPAVNQPFQTMPIRTEIPVPAGADTYDIANIRAGISAHIGALTQLSAELGNTAATGTI